MTASAFGLAIERDNKLTEQLEGLSPEEVAGMIQGFRVSTESSFYDPYGEETRKNRFIDRVYKVDVRKFILPAIERPAGHIEVLSTEEREKARVKAEGIYIVDVDRKVERRWAHNIKEKADKLHDLMFDLLAPTELAFSSAIDRLDQELKHLLKDNSTRTEMKHLAKFVDQMQEIKLIQELCNILNLDSRTTRTIIRNRCRQFIPGQPYPNDSLKQLLGSIKGLSSSIKKPTVSPEDSQDGTTE